ncbi:hypothetical protein CFOL_v3_15742 [Cephalotus follicularis]|uniref:UBN2_3 domain-containing protein n=1 Tax=Cephalotus follicularis TaxID=3775 RepID=A0A1Q3BW59_CEPFO|nr:hypothetical protein CFOL_v3_15742 [Cephalotus follicularis]
MQKLEQGTTTVNTYFAELSTLWQELAVYEDLYEDLDAATVTKLQTEERNRVYQFPIGLNYEFDVVVQTTLQKEPFPSLEEAFSAVNQVDKKTKNNPQSSSDLHLCPLMQLQEIRKGQLSSVIIVGSCTILRRLVGRSLDDDLDPILRVQTNTRVRVVLKHTRHKLWVFLQEIQLVPMD